MFRLRTLGDTGIEGPDLLPASQLVAQTKPFAVLCYLAIAGPGRFHRRDSVVALFWPELDHRHGRAGLRQCLRVIRQHLGEELVVNRGNEEIGLAADRIWCDAAEFERLCGAGAAEPAMRLYCGDLLPGLHVPGAGSDLAQWLDDNRARLRGRAQEMVRYCLERQWQAGSEAAASRWARRALEIDPFDEHALQILLRLLERSGDRPGAVRVYEEFATRLAAELEVRPSPETEQLIAAIRVNGAAPGHGAPQAPHPTEAPCVAEPAPADAGRKARPGAFRGWGQLLGAAVGIAALVLLTEWPRPADPVAVQPNLVAVMPWQVEDADTGLAYLREGMLDLLDATLTGERGLRSADPRTVLQSLHAIQPDRRRDVPKETALRVARRLGAGRVIQGAVLGSPARLTLVATEIDITHPGSAQGFRLSGSIDSLSTMVERLTALILAQETGDPSRVPGLLTASLPSLRSYLEGQAAFRRGLYGEAAHRLSLALAADSGFTLAALSLAGGGLTMADEQLMEMGRRIAWRDSSRLSPRDRALLKSVVGANYPDPSDEREWLAARTAAAALNPESPEAQYWLADSYFHHGRLLALPGWAELARSGFQRAIALDSGFAAPYQHLIELKLALGDTIGVRGLAATYVALDSTGEYGDFLRWRVAVGLGDSTALQALRTRFDRMSIESLYRIAAEGQVQGIALEDADRAVDALGHRTAGTALRYVAAYSREALRANEGRPAAALAETPDMASDRRRPLANRWFEVADALYGDGDRAAAARAVEELVPLATRRSGSTGASADSEDVATCAVSLWKVHLGQREGVDLTIRQLRRRRAHDPSGLGAWLHACATILEARLAAITGSPEAEAARVRLDSLADAGPSLVSPLRVATTLELSDLDERSGDLPGALAAVQRRENEYAPRYLSTQLLREARLAERLGDRRTAMRAYRHYLALRYSPEPSLRLGVDSVRAALAQLGSRLDALHPEQ